MTDQEKLLQELLAWTNKDPLRGCLQWKGPFNKKGYAAKHWGTTKMAVYPMVYSLVHGGVPKGLTVDHTCGNKECINPKHLEAVTQLENNRRYLERKRRIAVNLLAEKHGLDFLFVLALLLCACSSTNTTTHTNTHCITTEHGSMQDTECTNDSSHSVDSKGL